jgi:hypothetical protein
MVDLIAISAKKLYSNIFSAAHPEREQAPNQVRWPEFPKA